MRLVVVLGLINRMIRCNILLTSQKTAEVGGKCLAVTRDFRVATVSTDIVQKILSYVGTASVRETSSMRKCVLRVEKSLAGTSILVDVFLYFIQVFGFV